MTAPKRPLMPTEDRARLRTLAERAEQHRTETGTNQAYAQGVVDVLRWLVGDDYNPAAMLEQVTR